ncbi:MAG: hypothetical protein JNJ47_00840 [Alphaproteobacteria bacterium]|nr:hypothetical protein [Alphaproteobacteria bacterium]
MKFNSIALLTAITVLNAIPAAVLAQNVGNDNTGPVASGSDKGAAPSMGTSGELTGQVSSEMLPLQQQEAASTPGNSGGAASLSTDGGTVPTTGAPNKGSTMGNDIGNGDLNSGSKGDSISQ